MTILKDKHSRSSGIKYSLTNYTIMIEAQSQTPVVEEKQATPQKMTISQLLKDLDNGLDRKAIAAKYSLNMNQVRTLFDHPLLKGKRPKRATTKLPFVLVDDVTPGSDFDIDSQQTEDNVSENANEDTNTFNELND